MKNVSIVLSAQLLVGAACISGCGSPDATHDARLPVADTALSAREHPVAVASLPLRNGNLLEFYDMLTGVLVSEVGLAGVSPIVDMKSPDMSAGRWVAAVASLRPGFAVPKAIVDLETKYVFPPAGLSELPAAPDAPTAPLRGGNDPLGEILENSQPAVSTNSSFCGNGCCDATWTRNDLCNPSTQGTRFSWYYLNYGWSYQDSGGKTMLGYTGTVCAGTGTSYFSVSNGTGTGGNWSVPESTWSRFEWHDGCCSSDCRCRLGSRWSSFVNSQEDQHLHTYCGGFWLGG